MDEEEQLLIETLNPQSVLHTESLDDDMQSWRERTEYPLYFRNGK